MNVMSATGVMESRSKGMTLVLWSLRLVAAVILLQTLFFKFTGAPESVYIFTKVGEFSGLPMEPFGRIGSGIVELISAVLLMIPRTSATGAVIALGTMAGAIASHLVVLGIEVKGDGGLLFALAVIVAVSSAIIAVVERKNLPIIGAKLP
jgi:putative oxidoreductase